MGHGGHGLEVHDVAGRVADGLAEDGAGVLVDEGAIDSARSSTAKRASMPRVGARGRSR
jgi:hypothetical protein